MSNRSKKKILFSYNTINIGAIHNKIKKLREQSDLTQQEMADKLNMHLKTWQKVENGITKLDIERLQLIAEVLETTVEDLINVDDSVYINAIKDNEVGFNNSSVTINHKSGVSHHQERFL